MRKCGIRDICILSGLILVLAASGYAVRAEVAGSTFRTALAVADTVKKDTVNVRDSVTARDTVTAKDTMAAGDTLSAEDTLTGVQDTLSRSDSREYRDSLRYAERMQKKMIRDSLKAIKDSIRWAKPRILETGFIPDTMYYRRILAWTTGPYVNEYKPARIDTTYNDWYSEYPFYKEDVDAVYLGTIGSATRNADFFKWRKFDRFTAFAPYLTYSYTPETMPFYNTKTPYTELAYWGTLFSYKAKEELNVRFLHMQNITPELNVAFLLQNWTAAGMMNREETSNSSLSLTANYLGKRYSANGGFIHQKISRQENGGLQDSFLVRDTTVDAKTIPINLQDAENTLSRNTFFITHSYDIPLAPQKNPADTLLPADSTDRNELGDGTMLTLGHVGEVSRFYRYYTDNIALTDEVGRNFYNNAFYINPTVSSDSTRVFSVENKLYFNLQPWARDAVISDITGGIGHQWNSIYGFAPDMLLKGNYNIHHHDLYVYAGLGGEYRKYLQWGATARYSFLGYYRNDMEIDAHVGISFYPFKDKNEPVTLKGRFNTSLKEPDWFSQKYYSNHYVWNNSFGKVSNTEVKASLEIPKWQLEASFTYGLVNNYLYYDTLGVARQHGGLINVMSAYLKKNFKVWLLRFDNQVLFQYSSDRNVLPLPMLTLRLRYYLEFPVVRNVLTAQLGANATFNTLYYAPAYNPALGQFQLQTREKIGNNPYIDVFLNLQWKRVSLFVKVINVAQGWPTGDMFATYQYVKPYREFKIGIHWPFYFN